MLLNDAEFPESEQFPKDLQGITQLNALRLNHRWLEIDIGKLKKIRLLR